MTYVSIDIDLNDYIGDYSDKELIDELEDRGYKVFEFDKVPLEDQSKLLHELYLDYVDGKDLSNIVKKVLDELYMYVPPRK